MLANKCGIRDLPNEVSHMKNEVVIQKGHRYGYDQAILCCGVRFVEVGTLPEYEAAFNDKTVMAHFYNAAEKGDISREDWIRVAQKHNVPTFNDAAADVPPFALFGLSDQPALLLGTDILETFRRVSLDFRARKVRFQLRRCQQDGIIISTAPTDLFTRLSSTGTGPRQTAGSAWSSAWSGF